MHFFAYMRKHSAGNAAAAVFLFNINGANIRREIRAVVKIIRYNSRSRDNLSVLQHNVLLRNADFVPFFPAFFFVFEAFLHAFGIGFPQDTPF